MHMPYANSCIIYRWEMTALTLMNAPAPKPPCVTPMLTVSILRVHSFVSASRDSLETAANAEVHNSHLRHYDSLLVYSKILQISGLQYTSRLVTRMACRLPRFAPSSFPFSKEVEFWLQIYSIPA